MEDIPDPQSNDPGLIMRRQYHCQEKEIKVHSDEAEAQINLALLSATFLKNRQMTATAVSKKEKAEKDVAKKASPSAAAKKVKPAQKKQQNHPRRRKRAMKGEGQSDDNEEEKVEEEGEGQSDDNEEEKVEEDAFLEEVKQRAKNWFWTGFIAFAIFGPFVPADQDKKYQLQIFFTADGGIDNPSGKGGRSLLRKKKQEEDDKKKLAAPTSEQNDVKALGANTMTKVMKAGIAQHAANMHYQRNVVSVRQEMILAQCRYNAAMEQNCFWRGQLNSVQLQHADQHTKNHAVCIHWMR
ncbi:hypothetical protein IV203_001857 [Nitzschia inconspicua]|uniref:Uncharacterized protein n=1 Tax=Nitzschia inconspicua TaxID=303405 RepID=A0A9K3L7A1_9STRA|nr:hypothetical protein IV203_001857 [Nitzschia inconspicua]